MTPLFRPTLQPLEAREVPALAVLYTGVSLTLTGTPTATGDALMTVANTGGNNFQVTDGALNLGTYHVTRDITLRLAGFDRFVGVDLGGGTLTGSVLIDVGAGHRDTSTISGVSVYGNVGASSVAGDVTFRGGSGSESFSIAADGPGTTLDVGGSVRAVGKPVTAPVADSLITSPQSHVHGDVVTSRISYTAVFGTVDGDVTATGDSPGGIGLALYGTVHGDVTVTGGATADGYSSSAYLGGTVGGDVRLNLSGRASVGTGGTVGGDWSFRHTGGGTATVALSGTVLGDVECVAKDDGPADETDLFIDYLVGGDLRFRQTGAGGSSVVTVGGYVAGDATVDLGGAGTASGVVNLDGAVGGSATVTGRSKTVLVHVDGFPGNEYAEFGVSGKTAVTGDLTVRLGNGTNTLSVSQFVFNPLPVPRTIGGQLRYTGGTGADTVLINGKFAFKAAIDTGGGADTVAFAPDATVGSAAIDFGAGTDTWVPPTVITFPLKLKKLP